LDPAAREAVFAHLAESADLTVLCAAHDAESATFADRRVDLSKINGRPA
jgi:ABC-type lipoprotein export system ATPase subunit